MLSVLADAAASGKVVRDFGVIILGALVIGLIVHGVRHAIFGFRKPTPDPPAPPPPPAPETTSLSAIPLPPQLPQKTQRRWKFGIDASHFTVLDLLLCLTIVGIFLAGVFMIDPVALEKEIENKTTPSSYGSISQLFQSVIYYGFIVFLIVSMISWSGQRSPSQVFGLKNQPFFPAIGWILVFSAVAVFAVSWMGEMSANYAEYIFNNIQLQGAVESFQQATSPTQIVVLTISAVIVAPLFEELVFRGYLYGSLKKFTEPMFAACLSGAFFGIIHVTIPAILPLWFFGIFLAFAYEATRSLWVPIGIHAVYNAASVAYIILMKNQPAVEKTTETASVFIP